MQGDFPFVIEKIRPVPVGEGWQWCLVLVAVVVAVSLQGTGHLLRARLRVNYRREEPPSWRYKQERKRPIVGVLHHTNRFRKRTVQKYT